MPRHDGRYLRARRACRWICLGAATALVGCHSQKPAQSRGAPAAARAIPPPPSARPVPDLRPGPPAHPSPLSKDKLWREAAGGAAIDLHRLSDREGAAGLLRGLDAGGTLALTALQALPSASDAELALPRLCGILRDGQPRRIAPVLVAVQAIVARPARPVEALDPEGMRRCGPVLAKLEKDAQLTPHQRDLAASARAMLAEHL